MVFTTLIEYSDRIRDARARNEKLEIIRVFLSHLKKEEAEIGVNYIAGRTRQGKLNLTWKGLLELSKIASTQGEPADLIGIDRCIEQVRAARGKEKLRVLAPLFAQLSAREREHLMRLIVRDVRHGAGEGVVKAAIAQLFNLTEKDVERASLHEPELGRLFVFLLDHGAAGIQTLGVKIFRPLKPMLAQIAESTDEILDEYNDIAVEHKLDGIRIQLHRKDDEVMIFSRHLKDITIHFPELVTIARTIGAREFILDGEAIGIDASGGPLPFQTLAKRTTRLKGIDAMKEKIPVVPKFFDILYNEGRELTKYPYAQRWNELCDVVKEEYRVHREHNVDKRGAQRFFEQAITQRHEGIMVKLLDSQYEAGKRGSAWFKIKRVHTIDCVVLAAEWGHGRRERWLSNLHLGVLDETRTKFLMVGKTFKGLTDSMMQWLTEHLQEIKVHDNAWTIHVKPAIVLEIAFNEVQDSPKYDSGFALRFARVKHIRHDKDPHEINTVLDLEKFVKRGGMYEL